MLYAAVVADLEAWSSPSQTLQLFSKESEDRRLQKIKALSNPSRSGCS